MEPMPGVLARSLWGATATSLSGRQRASERGPSPHLAGDVDVAIVGAGYTGLWTALSLMQADPAVRVAVIERHHVGFGASGRNGGWCSALLPIGLGALAKRHGRDAAIAMQRAMIDTVGAVESFTRAARRGVGIDAQFHRGGTLSLARSMAQREVLRAEVAEAREFGFGQGDLRLLEPDERRARCRAETVESATYTPHCAAIHPLELANAIAAAARGLGVCIAEGVDVTEVAPGSVTTSAGTVRAATVVLATEAYTTQLPRRRRSVLPLYSMVIGSEPLTDEQWGAIGLTDRETFTSAANMIIYGQRTADGRLAFGGRGAPYHFGSRIADRFDTDERVRSMLRSTLAELFPVTADVEFPFHWGGPLGVPRDWHPHVALDRVTGIASAGGYVGDGVAAANLAGRTLADLVLGRDTELTSLAWVGHRSRRWEPEPLRWIGAHVAATAAVRADDDGRLAPAWSRLLGLLTGH